MKKISLQSIITVSDNEFEILKNICKDKRISMQNASSIIETAVKDYLRNYDEFKKNLMDAEIIIKSKEMALISQNIPII